MSKQEVIGLVGLGYVGLPLALAFAEKFDVVGFDVNKARVAELQAGRDHTGEGDVAKLKNPRLTFTCEPQDLKRCTFVIVAVPTPVNAANEPDLEPVEKASETVGAILQKGMLVSYESTVYPGVTEDICLPILEKKSGLKLGDFDLGYSPERVNPGDKQHTVTTIRKIVSGHNAAALARAAAVYGAVVTAGVHQAPNIMTAEAAKVVENVQRDLNIALMNELSKIFSRMGIHTQDVIEAAGSKWNFHRYHPGLVGGHCIGVDPYYLVNRAIKLGYYPEVIQAGRRINDGMGFHVGELTVRALNESRRLPAGANIWVLGMTFKENVPDFRNTRAIDVVKYLKGFKANVKVWEPHATPEQLQKSFGVETLLPDQARDLDAIVLINAHDAFKGLKLADLKARMRTPVLMDVKNFFNRAAAQQLGFNYVSL
ncbi:MAG: nucleotide sugar dehydrogenase, partial [Kiritimatiellaeota bacterium]|nr:nucleotide sugar dehydrogenase [Kiritimatiellota bacterium]